MCLEICSESHVFNERKGLYKPKIALKRIKVYKVLIQKSGVWQTPFQDTPVHFHNGRVVIISDMYGQYQTNCEATLVYDGVHAIRNIMPAKHFCWAVKMLNFRNFYCGIKTADIKVSEMLTYNGYNIDIFEAYIPPFTRYFIGDGGDIVSEKLIIKNKIVK